MISIVVPVYNVYPFLDECIESIRNQTYKDLEIILVDDGSTDNSGMKCDIYSENDDRIKVIHQDNQGLSAARNVGIKAAKGEFLMFVDSDDRIHPMMAQTLYSVMEHDVDIVICSYRKIKERETVESFRKDISVEEQDIEVLSGRECVKRMYSSVEVDMTVAWNKLYRKSSFRNLQYPVGRLHEDDFLTYKILYDLRKCVYLKLPLYEYRIREGSIMCDKSVRRLKDEMEAFKERCSYFKQKNDNELYCQALRRYETSIAELILFLKENHLKSVLIQELYEEFRLVYKKSIASSDVSIWNKLKFVLFMKNSAVYKFLKNIDGKRTNVYYGKEK